MERLNLQKEDLVYIEKLQDEIVSLREKNRQLEQEQYRLSEKKINDVPENRYMKYEKILADNRNEIKTLLLGTFLKIIDPTPSFRWSNSTVTLSNIRNTYHWSPTDGVDEFLDFIVNTQKWDDFLKVIKEENLEQKFHYFF